MNILKIQAVCYYKYKLKLSDNITDFIYHNKYVLLISDRFQTFTHH